MPCLTLDYKQHDHVLLYHEELMARVHQLQEGSLFLCTQLKVAGFVF